MAALLGAVSTLLVGSAPAQATDQAGQQTTLAVAKKVAVPTAAELLSTATNKAAKENKRVLLLEGVLGSTGTKDIEAIFARDRDLRRTMLYEYELLTRTADAGSTLVILDGTGKEIARTASAAVANDGVIDAKKLNAFLQKHKAAPLDARKVLASALALAKKQKKNVYVHLGAPW